MAIPTSTKVNHHIGNAVEDIHASIRAEDFPFLANMLDGMYSDPIAACVREYSTNAFDSHVEAGITRPIEITLPTSDSLEFVVQDFGVGLNVDDLRTVYSLYGRSTKRESNDVAGMLGLGCKSALSYCDAFTIVAVKGGVKTIAVSTKDETGLGVIKVLDTVGTDEPNGVTIKIPVERYDVHQFEGAAEHLFQFWEPGQVLVNGVAPEIPEWRSTALMLDDDTFLIDHTTASNCDLWRSYVIMGNVPYPVNDADCGRVSHRFVARLNIGDVEITPSREEVKYNDWSKETLSDLSEYIRVTFRRILPQTLAQATTAWEEAMLKVLWMDRGLRIDADVNNPIWNFDPSGYGRKASRTFRYSLSGLTSPKTAVITKFPSKTVSAQARDRLAEFCPDASNFVILPEKASTVHLGGRPNTHTWDEVVGGTVTVTKAAKAKRAKYETRYDVAVAGGASPMTADEIVKMAAAASLKTLYAYPNEGLPYLGRTDVLVVKMRSTNQRDRIERLIPGIERIEVERKRQFAKAEKAVTDHDRAMVQAQTLPQAFHGLDPDEVADPELADVLRLHAAPPTATMDAARKFGIEIKAKGGSLSKVFLKRYPLLDSQGYYTHIRVTEANRADLLLYINSKFDAITDPALDSKAS